MLPRVALACSGLGHVRRGHEQLTEELARALLPLRDRIELRVYGGNVSAGLPGRSIPCLRRGWLERLGREPLGAYRTEQLSFGAAMLPDLIAFRPDVVYVSDPALASALFHARRALPRLLRYRILFANGGQGRPMHYARFDHVQLVGDWQLEAARAYGIPEDRASVLPLGVTTARFGGLPPAGELRRKLRLPGGRLLVSVAALDASVKRVDYVIRGLALSDPAWTLVCVGNRTRETGALEALAGELAPGRVIFRTVPADEVPGYLGAADAFVLASRSEGFGIALVEAMASGLPVIVRDLPSLRSIVQEPTQVASLEDPAQLALIVSRLEDPHLRRSLGELNRRRASDFDWPRLAPSYVEMLTRLAAQTPGMGVT